MWNCRITSGDVSTYGAYSKVVDNLIGFFIYNERSARTYVDLIEENRSLFLEESDKSATSVAAYNCEVVEPRELLTLLNYIDTADRLYWAPRPYRRSGDITKEYLFACPKNDTLACLLCGYNGQTPYETRCAPTDGGITRTSVFDETSLATVPERGNQNEYETLMALQENIMNAVVATYNTVRNGNPTENVEGVDETDYIPIGLHEENNDPDESNIQQQQQQPQPPSPPPPPPRQSNSISQPYSDNSMTFRIALIRSNNSQPSNVQRPSPTPRRNTSKRSYHFEKCPLVWLEKNCNWRTKYSTSQIHEPSKFVHALQTLQRGRRSMSTEMEWNEFAKLSSIVGFPGACENTLIKCYRMLVQMKLDNVDRYHGDSREFRLLPLYTVYYETNQGETMTRPKFCRPVACVLEHSSLYGTSSTTYRHDGRSAAPLFGAQFVMGSGNLNVPEEETLVKLINEKRVAEEREEGDKSRSYLSHLLTRSSETPCPKRIDNVVDDAAEIMTYTIETETAWRAFVMHGFCIQNRSDHIGDGIYHVDAVGSFSGSKSVGYTIRHKMRVPSSDMVCIYCNYSFNSGLCDPDVVDKLYDEAEKTLISTYLLARSPQQTTTVLSQDNESWTWWNRKPVGLNRHLALSLEDVLSPPARNHYKRFEKKNRLKCASDAENEMLALWLSASLNNCHSSECIFRFRQREWSCETCPICLIENITNQNSLFVCGHTLCNTCTNDIRLTDCPLCKKGTRKRRLQINIKSNG